MAKIIALGVDELASLSMLSTNPLLLFWREKLKLKFQYGSIICFYNGNSEFKFIQRSGYGTGKDLDTFNSLSDAIQTIANRSGWLGNINVYQLS